MNQKDRDECLEIRREIFRVARSGGAAHLASCFSSVEILYTLYIKGVLQVRPKEPAWAQRDRFVLSKGHSALALYAVLCEVGFLSREELHSYLQPGCHIGGEPNVRDLPGIEASTGSLGHGMSAALGMALAQKMDYEAMQQKAVPCGIGMPDAVPSEDFATELSEEADRRPQTYVLIGDGESEEGTIWEAAMSAAALKLHNLTVILDHNRLQKTNRVEETLGETAWEDKWKAFGFNVLNADGHDIEDLAQKLKGFPQNDKPNLLIANTIKGKGVSIMEDNPIWHYRMPNRKETKVFLEELGMEEES